MLKKVFILCLALVFFSGNRHPVALSQRRVLLGTFVEITVADRDKSPQSINQAITKAFAEINRLEGLLSKFKPGSDISRINASTQTGQAVQVSAETIQLIARALEFSRLTNGAFDITIAPLSEAWEDSRRQNAIPEAALLKQRLSEVGYWNVQIYETAQSVCLTKRGMGLDLGGIAKGYAVDRAVAVLRAEGINNALVNAGGDIYALGRPEPERKWQIAVQHPRQKDNLLAVLELENMAVATSGDYENYFEHAGRRLSHIINPKTAQPCANNPASVTVLSPDCLSADALATSMFVLGPEEGLKLASQLNNTEVLIASFPEPGQKGKLTFFASPGLSQTQFCDEQDNI